MSCAEFDIDNELGKVFILIEQNFFEGAHCLQGAIALFCTTNVHFIKAVA